MFFIGYLCKIQKICVLSRKRAVVNSSSAMWRRAKRECSAEVLQRDGTLFMSLIKSFWSLSERDFILQ